MTLPAHSDRDHVDQVDQVEFSTDDADAAARLLKALAHSGRIRIVRELAAGDRCVHELVGALGIPQPTVSQHLQVLRAARLVTATRIGKEQRYELREQHVRHIVDGALIHAAELD